MGHCTIQTCVAEAAAGYTVCSIHLEAARARHYNAQTAVTSDTVSSPAHYTRFPGVEVIQLTRHLNFNRGNAIKYLARAGYKGPIQDAPESECADLKKALWYIADECQRLGVSQEEIQKIVEKHK